VSDFPFWVPTQRMLRLRSHDPCRGLDEPCTPSICAMFFFFFFFIQAGWESYGQVLRQLIRRTTLDYNVPRLYAHVVVDNQQICAQVDTGSPELTVIWKDWYEHVTRPGSCTTLQMGCYTCPKGCDSKPTIKITYGFKEVSVFPWQGSVQLGDTVVGKLGFGVIK
ncbi:hypothetical protein FOZ62_012879, partial [Perkinsus olseni]